MMVMHSLFPVIKAVLLLVVSFFVLAVVTKVESKNLKTFGRLLGFTLWVIAVVIIIGSLLLRSMSPSYKMHKGARSHKTMKCR